MTSRPRISGTLDPKRVEHVPFPASQKIGSGAGTPRGINFTRGTAPAIIRSLQSKLIAELPSVLDWSGDDTTRFQSATAEIGASGGGHIIVPPDHLWMLEDTVLTVHPNTHFVGTRGTQVSRVPSDFGPSFQWGNAGSLLAGGGAHNLFLRGNLAMTPGVSKALLAFDHVEDNMCTNLTMQDGCGFFSMAGCNNFVGSNIMASLTGGSPAGRSAIRVFKSTATGLNSYPIGGDIVFDNINMQCGFGPGIDAYADNGILIETVDGFYLSGHSHILFTNVAHVHVRPNGADRVYNVELDDVLLDASSLHAIWLDGSVQTARAVRLRFKCALSSFLAGAGSAVGMYVSDNFWVQELLLDATIEGYQNGAVVMDSDWVETATIIAEAYNCGQSVFNINRGQDITLVPRTHPYGVNGLAVGPTVKRLRVKGGSLEGNSGFGASIAGSAGSAAGGGIDFTGTDFRNNGAPIVVGSGAVVSAFDCPGLTPIYGSTAYNPGTIATGGRTFTSVSVPGAKMGDRVIAVTLSVDRLGIEVEAYMAADGSASVLYINDTGAGKTLGSHTLEVAVQRKL
jgi:hypothetical protein